MLKLYLLPIAIALLTGCATEPDNNETLTELRAIRQEMASLSDSIASLKDSLNALQPKRLEDTAVAPAPTKPAPNTPTAPIKKPKPAETKPTVTPNVPKESTDTIYHKYVNGKVSVKITPWVDGKRQVLFYDLYGNQTFDLEEVRHSYTVRAELKFAPNGSVHTAVVHTNPGASMYWYESEITFSTINEPISKIDHRYPQNSLDDLMNEKWIYWDKRTKTWKQQEVME